MKLTNPIKRQLALDIVAAAAAKHAPALIATAEKLHQQWREAYKAHFRFVAPTLAEAFWVPLLQVGALNSVSRHGTLEVVEYAGMENAPLRKTSDDLSVRKGYEMKGTGLGKDHFADLVVAVKSSFTSCPMLSCYGYEREIRVNVSITDKCHDIPGCSAVAKVNTLYAGVKEGDSFDPTEEGRTWYQLAGPLIKPTRDLVALYTKVFVEADVHHRELTTALAAVSSRAQLIELFPEAEQFLPEPPAPKSKIVPATLFANARKMLEEGIPT